MRRLHNGPRRLSLSPRAHAHHISQQANSGAAWRRWWRGFPAVPKGKQKTRASERRSCILYFTSPLSILCFYPEIKGFRESWGRTVVPFQRLARSRLLLLFNRYFIVWETSSCEEAEKKMGRGGGWVLERDWRLWTETVLSERMNDKWLSRFHVYLMPP